MSDQEIENLLKNVDKQLLLKLLDTLIVEQNIVTPPQASPEQE